MIRMKSTWVVLGLVALMSVAVLAADPWAFPVQPGLEAKWVFNNETGGAVTGFHLEFDQAVEVSYSIAIGGDLMLVQAAGTVFDFVGELVPFATFYVEWTPVDAVPSLAMWMAGERPVGSPFFTTIDKLGYLFGQGIVMMREANPAALLAAFEQFFLDNAEYLGTVSQSLGMSLEDSLMPIIMTSPAEGIQNFFATIVGMIGVTSLEGVLDGAVDFTALFAVLGL